MVKREGDETPTPPGGRAAQRLREFEDARRPQREKGKEDTPGQDQCPPEAKENPEQKTPPPSTSN